MPVDGSAATSWSRQGRSGSAWGMDWEPLPPERIVELVERDLAPGTIVLLHDSSRYGHRPSALPTAQALPAIADGCSSHGLELVALE